MKYIEFEDIMSKARMHRYLIATGNNSRKAMTFAIELLTMSQFVFNLGVKKLTLQMHYSIITL